MHEGLSTRMEHSGKIQQPHFCDRYFHLIIAYFKMIGKKMAGSGFSDVLLEAGMSTTGSMTGLMNGKNYDGALNCHTVTIP